MKERKCKTPGANYHISIQDRYVRCDVALPNALDLDEQGAKRLEDRIHDAMEAVLAEYFSESR